MASLIKDILTNCPNCGSLHAWAPSHDYSIQCHGCGTAWCVCCEIAGQKCDDTWRWGQSPTCCPPGSVDLTALGAARQPRMPLIVEEDAEDKQCKWLRCATVPVITGMTCSCGCDKLATGRRWAENVDRIYVVPLSPSVSVNSDDECQLHPDRNSCAAGWCVESVHVDPKQLMPYIAFAANVLNNIIGRDLLVPCEDFAGCRRDKAPRIQVKVDDIKGYGTTIPYTWSGSGNMCHADIIIRTSWWETGNVRGVLSTLIHEMAHGLGLCHIARPDGGVRGCTGEMMETGCGAIMDCRDGKLVVGKETCAALRQRYIREGEAPEGGVSCDYGAWSLVMELLGGATGS